MTQPKRRFRRDIAWPFLLAGAITLCSGFPAAVPEVGFLQLDKVGHLAAYGALATAVIRIRDLARWPLIGLWWALPLASAYGLGDEFRQSLTGGVRSCDWRDWVADTIGAALAVTCYIVWPWYRRLMERPLFPQRPKPRAAEVPSNK